MNQEKYNILIVTENLDIGGAEKYTVLIANELFKRGHKVVVMANDGPFRKHFDPRIRFVRVFFEHGIWGVLYGVFQMIRISFQENIDFIHAQKLESSQAAWLARFVTGVPVVKTAHGYTAKELITLGKKIDKYSDKVITVDDWLSGELVKNGVKHEKLSVIYNGTNPIENNNDNREQRAQLRVKLGIGTNDKVMVTVSRLVKGKNHKELIEWFKLIHEQLPNVKLVFVGDGPEHEVLLQKVLGHDLNGSVVFVGATTNIIPYLEIADIFCTPGVGRGMAVLEAMAAGLPVIGRQPISGPEVIVEGETGSLFPRGDGETFVKKVLQLLKDQPLAQRFGLAGKRRVEEVLSCELMVDQLEQVYRQVV
jgi:glycosyltransferase involved in cell wall biosynthesis